MEMYKTYERGEERHHAICDHCGKTVYPSAKNIYLWHGFECMDTGMFVSFDCRQDFYAKKNAGEYGVLHAGKYMERPVSVPWEKEPVFAAPCDDDEPEVDYNSNHVVRWVGQFGYNENDVCIHGAINVTEISIDRGKVYASAEVAQTSHGWAYGARYGTSFTHTGAGGSRHGIWFDSRYQYHSREDASIAALYSIMRGCESNQRNAPASAAKVLQKAIDVLKAQIGGEPEPKAFDILQPILERKPEPAKILTDPKQPLQLQLNFF